ncbi:hypothetical protein [Chitinophaga filiformis]|uniref:FecR protein n=1 Tax=Chitinophaga filiformis TaxID=104663 RepID=A0A1G7MJQ3_CHIFI|nr:hypothetical protein [Chitinophaga filiformis]SDF61389.1 hypothetical protein SAMN04488121_102441 [Chitinophaga filiformis]
MKRQFLWFLVLAMAVISSACQKAPNAYLSQQTYGSEKIFSFDSEFRVMVNKHSELSYNINDQRFYLKGGSFIKIEGLAGRRAPVTFVASGVALQTSEAEINIDAYDIASGRGKLTILNGVVKIKNNLTDTSITSGGYWFGPTVLDSDIDWLPAQEVKWLDKCYSSSSMRVDDLVKLLYQFYATYASYGTEPEFKTAIFEDVHIDIREPLVTVIERLERKGKFKFNYYPQYNSVIITKKD